MTAIQLNYKDQSNTAWSAELETIRRAMFAGLVEGGVLTTDKDGQVAARRLVHDHRQIALAQLQFENALLMTPAARVAAKAGNGDAGAELDDLLQLLKMRRLRRRLSLRRRTSPSPCVS
ncbi:MAG: hypothetical protein JO166_07875 [Deltaproteobacteria bacterium]|nr:hypothetical protein [Deltaproteobacteria bacterium]